MLSEESAFGQGSQEAHAQLDGEQAAAKAMGEASACAERRQPTYLQFPQNIASIRAEHATMERETASNPQLAPRRFLELDMRDAGASLDLPPVYQPQLSTRSDELSLQQLMDTLGIYVRPRAVMVVATDVRDRLFMLSVVRRAVPGAIPAALEGDHLLTHPDYRRANRGTLMVANGPMRACYVQVIEGERQYRSECPRTAAAMGAMWCAARAGSSPSPPTTRPTCSGPAKCAAADSGHAPAAAPEPRRNRSPLSVVTWPACRPSTQAAIFPKVAGSKRQRPDPGPAPRGPPRRHDACAAR